MANFKLTQTGEQIQADLNLLDSNSATSGQVLTANGTGGASWQNASGGSSVTPFTGYNITTVGDSNPSSKSSSINVMKYNNTYYSYSTSTLGDSVEGAYAIWWYGDYDTNYPQKFTGTLIDSTDGSQVTGSNTNINTLTAKRMYYVASDLVIDTSN